MEPNSNQIPHNSLVSIVSGWKRRSLVIQLLTTGTTVAIIVSSGAARTVVGQLLVLGVLALAARGVFDVRRRAAAVSKLRDDVLKLNHRELVQLRFSRWIPPAATLAVLARLHWGPLTSIDVGLIVAFIGAGLFVQFGMLPRATADAAWLRVAGCCPNLRAHAAPHHGAWSNERTR